MSGNLYTQGEVTGVPGEQARPAEPAQADGKRGRLGLPVLSGPRLRAYWLSNPGKVTLIATALALALRLFTLTRTGYLTGITEYDDGVYLGGAVRMLEGQLPYLNFALVQPPGILELMLPVALFAKLTTTVQGLALARLLTALASTACVPLAGNLVRYRGAVVTAVTCGVLAVYPPDVTTAHTLMLEPWMNLCCLIAMNAAFRRGHLARPRRLLWAGLILGYAGDIKFWAAAPAIVLFVLCLATGSQRARRVRSYLTGLVLGFVVPAAPFLVLTPLAFVRSTILDQASRTGSAVALGVRLANITGLIDFYTTRGRLSLNAGAHSMYAAGTSAGLSTSNSLGWLPILAMVLLAAAITAGYALQSRRLTPLEWLSLASLVLAIAAITGYSAFFYHYADFPAPWLALSLGGAAGALAGRLSVVAVRAFAVLVLLVAALQVRETFPLREPGAETMSHYIPAGACVITDQVSLTIDADRFVGMPPGCPDIIDSLAETLVLSNGVSVQGGADKMPRVVAQWKKWMGEAQYVWLSAGHASRRRIPWTPGLSEWFNAHFTEVSTYPGALGSLYVRLPGAPSAPLAVLC